jgi:hypothetical protein
MPRTKGSRARRSTKVLSPERKAELHAIRMKNLLKGGDNEAVKAAREQKRSDAKSIRDELQSCDIITFATKFLKLKLDGFPALELMLRCSHGLPLPEGKVKTYIEIDSNAFAVKEVEMGWPEYFALLSVASTPDKPHLYKPGKPPAIFGARLGRRSTKSTFLSISGVHTGIQSRWRAYVRSNEIIKIPIIATSQEQAEEIITQRCHELLKDSEMDWLIGALDEELHHDKATDDTIPLITGAEISAFPCNSKKVRGPASPLVMLDEYAHFALEGHRKDKDIRSAATGSQGQFPGCQEYMTSTPLVEEGDFYETEKLARAGDPDILFFHAPSWTAAPLLYRNNPEYYHRKFRHEPDLFNIEFRAEYGTSRSPAFSDIDIDAAQVLLGELPFDPACRYGAGIDQSGLSGNDRFSLVICGYDPRRDVCFEARRKSWSITNLDLIMAECRDLLHLYRVYEVAVDRYAHHYVANALAHEGITAIAAGDSTDLCVEFRQLLIAHKMQLPVDSAVKLGLQQTNMVVTEKARKPIVWHPRGKAGHGDEVDARFRASHQAMTSSWSRSRALSQDDREKSARRQRDQDSYDPLTWGRC